MQRAGVRRSALAAAHRWTFAPGTDEGSPVPMCIDLAFPFERGATPKKTLLPPADMMPQPAPKTSASLEDRPLGDPPAGLVGRGLQGQVIYRAVVGADGKVRRLRILAASHADYVLPALAASADWKFRPAMSGDLPVQTTIEGEVFYQGTKLPPREKVLAANGITAPDGTVHELQPALVGVVDPIWPYDLLLAGREGVAAVAFTIQPDGSVTDIAVVEASDPQFGAALIAATAACKFEGALEDGVGKSVRLVRHAEFKLPAQQDDPDTWELRLVKLVREHGIKPGGSLDQKLTPLYQAAPPRPDAPAKATVEFIVDRDGRARLPHVVNASDPAFGWAAATAVGQWVFNPPRRGGQPTEVKVQIPIAY